MLTDKQIEREEAFVDDWYMVRKMGKTPTFADAIAWADSHPNWIKVEDGLPETDDFVLVVIEATKGYPYVTTAAYFPKHSKCWSQGSVTHWMPIIYPERKAKSMLGWNNVEKSLPTTTETGCSDWVLGYCGYGELFCPYIVARYDYECEEWIDENGNAVHYVTHWQDITRPNK